jgi:acyl-coenzyme A thioesterase PaaI-like protein
LAENEVVAEYQVDKKHQGYTNLLHGGIASTLLDAAVTHCFLKATGKFIQPKWA